jgi:hypothetical protein
VDHHDLPITAEVHVELETVGPKRQSVLERVERVLGAELGATAVREHEWPLAPEDRMVGDGR